jgi:hypothetical protein
MGRNHLDNREGQSLFDRVRQRLTGRRRFLAGAGRYGAFLLGAAYTPGGSGSGPAYAQAPTQSGDDGTTPVEHRSDIVRIIGLAQRRPGLTRLEASFADSPHIVPSYYARVHRQLTQKTAGREVRTNVLVVTDCAFGGDRLPPPGPHNLHIDVPDPEMPCTTLSNRDMVCDVAYLPFVQGGRTGGQGWSPNMPRWVEPGTELNLALRQVLAQGTRPLPAAGGPRALFFMKMSSAIAASNQLKVWQTLHARAVEAVTGFADGLQGYEVLQRLPEVAPRQPNKCGGEIVVPDLVAGFWPKDGLRNFPDYARAFRRLDKENAVDLPASFFLLVNELEHE